MHGSINRTASTRREGPARKKTISVGGASHSISATHDAKHTGASTGAGVGRQRPQQQRYRWRRWRWRRRQTVRRSPWLFRSRDVVVAAAPKPLDSRQAEDDDEVEQEYDGGGEMDATRAVAHHDCRDAHRCGMWVVAGFKWGEPFSPLCLV